MQYLEATHAYPPVDRGSIGAAMTGSIQSGCAQSGCAQPGCAQSGCVQPDRAQSDCENTEIDPMTLASLDIGLYEALEKIGTSRQRICSALWLSYAEYDYISSHLDALK